MGEQENNKKEPVDCEKDKKKRYILFKTTNKVLKERLFAAITSLREEAESYEPAKSPESVVKKKESETPELEKAKEKAIKALDEAKVKAEKCEFDLSWNYIHIAEQHLVKCMNEDQQIVKANMLRIETEDKIKGWRQKQISLLLGEPGSENQPRLFPYTADNIIEVMKIRDDYFNTRIHRMSLRKANLNMLATALVVILFLIFIANIVICVCGCGYFNLQLFNALLFGMLGASFSMAYTISNAGIEAKIPEQLQSIGNTVIRLVIGGISAIIIFFFLKANMLDKIFSKDILATPYAYIVIAFLSGISERWVMSIFGLVTKENDKK